MFNRYTKKDLKPATDKYHKIGSINEFLSTVFDDYAIEYGQYFVDEVDEFDAKFDDLKREI